MLFSVFQNRNLGMRITVHLPIKTGANAQTKGDLSILATMAPFDPAVAQERDDGASIF